MDDRPTAAQSLRRGADILSASPRPTADRLTTGDGLVDKSSEDPFFTTDDTDAHGCGVGFFIRVIRGCFLRQSFMGGVHLSTAHATLPCQLLCWNEGHVERPGLVLGVLEAARRAGSATSGSCFATTFQLNCCLSLAAGDAVASVPGRIFTSCGSHHATFSRHAAAAK